MTGVNVKLNEADTRAKLIDPAIHKRGWTEDLIRREETAGAVEIIYDKPRRRPRGQIDYVLRCKVNPDTQPVALALIEAKQESLPPGHGLEQAREYAKCKRLNVKFVFSSNGHQFVEYDSFTRLTSAPKPMTAFPTPADLRTRYEQGMRFSLESLPARPLLQRYAGGEVNRRYYQDAAIRAVMEKIAQQEKADQPNRALLSMATGCGKTRIAVNLLKRISDAGNLTRALFVCDRDELRTQANAAFQHVFGADAAEAYRKPDGSNNAKNARIHIATYQTLGMDSEAGDDTFLTRHYPENHFSHIVIDECHRSAWGTWSKILTRNHAAVQIGLTATPRELRTREDTEEAREDEKITANNLKYFGEPVYEYNVSQAMEDGYLAACEIRKGRVNLDEKGLTIDQIMERNPVDATTGRALEIHEIESHYSKDKYEGTLLLPDRVQAMCEDLFKYLIETGGPEQKTIIFCVRDSHADSVAVCMNNLYTGWCTENQREPVENYAFKCTAASDGNSQLPDFRGASRGYFVATTVDLLTTGVDVPCVRNIVFFRYLKSPISFYQMIGRGTRIDVPTNKLMFRIYDYTNATRLFGEDFITNPSRTSSGQGSADSDVDKSHEQIQVEGFEVTIIDAGRYIVADVDGKATPITLDEYKARLAERLVREVPTLEDFRSCWIDLTKRNDLLTTLRNGGYSPELVRVMSEREDYDLYDVLAELCWGMNPRTRVDRAQAFIYKHKAWLDGFPERPATVISAIVRQFGRSGTDGLENPRLFQTPEVEDAGGVAALKQAGTPRKLIDETKARMFAS
ncbi:MAG: DEAD/DEAH box helicase family protein [Nitrospira sp.]|nr:DEAD/DEAH box helicase family protein [Nitrospira sp.]